MRTRRWLLNTVTAAILATLGACGGGGDGGEPVITGPTIAITAVNRDAVAHATVAGLWAFSPSNLVPLAVGSGRSISVWLSPLSKAVGGAWAEREGALATMGPVVRQCNISGSESLTLLDINGDGLPSAVGEVLTVTYDNCQDYVGETANGAMTMTFTALSASGGSARVAMSNLLFDKPYHAMTVNGSMLADYTPGLIETTRATAEGPVTVAVSLKHLVPAFVDTVTLQNGFFLQEVDDTSRGHTVTSFGGLMRSQAANGVVDVNTMANAEIRAYDDAYPYAGTVKVKGKNGTLWMTVQSVDGVKLDLDADDNGAFESTEVKPWDWLL